MVLTTLTAGMLEKGFAGPSSLKHLSLVYEVEATSIDSFFVSVVSLRLRSGVLVMGFTVRYTK